jgi:outer membrane receptor protein involved in Fe transport
VIFGPPEINPLQILSPDEQHANSLAGYGQLTIPLADKTNLTLGARYTNENHNIMGRQTLFIPGGPVIADTPYPERSARFSKPSFRVALDHHITDDTMVYASFNRGFKAGGQQDRGRRDGHHQRRCGEAQGRRSRPEVSELALNATVQHSGRFYLEPDNVMKQDDYTRLNSSIAWRPANHRYGVTLWGRNLTNEAVISYGGTLVSGLRTVGYEAPRTYGVTLEYHYN